MWGQFFAIFATFRRKQNWRFSQNNNFLKSFFKELFNQLFKELAIAIFSLILGGCSGCFGLD
jgi:hypothetical protein